MLDHRFICHILTISLVGVIILYMAYKGHE